MDRVPSAAGRSRKQVAATAKAFFGSPSFSSLLSAFAPLRESYTHPNLK
jgi:hypothetical protein